MVRRIVSLLVVLVLGVLGACSDDADPSASRRDVERGDAGEAEEEEEEEEEPPTTRARLPVSRSRPYDDLVEAAVDDVQAFWSVELPRVYGERYEPVDDVIAVQARTRVPDCGGEPVPARAVRGNAFYCFDADYVAYDDVALFPGLYEEYGDLSVAGVLAHELGHAVQQRVGMDGLTIQRELQADCFAGAWMRHLDDQGGAIEVDDGALDMALAGYLTFRDAPGSDPEAEDAHGSAFDRVNAFQEGFERGVDRCAEYEDPALMPVIVEIPFTDITDARSGGDAPFADVIPVTVDDLDEFWLSRVPGFRPLTEVVAVDPTDATDGCGGTPVSADDLELAVVACPDGSVLYDEVYVEEVYDAIGDFAVATLFGRAWASAVQTQAGITADDRARALHADCLTGAWTGSTAVGDRPDEDPLTLSPGDLDEELQALFVENAVAEDRGQELPPVFERIAALRAGFFAEIEGDVDPLGVCAPLLEAR